eukprot:TRINITY_DN4172_c0_g2_i1.p1 TRINITY_DN4172_c0_g2~~TRINITY_DN4172_c0_g2_i1.p1  ORF type:complete len:696 (-),score=148.25 TRINITY_DN4172_c0_g2_i1:77-2164(-)
MSVMQQKPKITAEMIALNFHLPLPQAAAVLGVCAAQLKRICRGVGIARWPQRKLLAVNRTLDQVQGGALLSPSTLFTLAENIFSLRDLRRGPLGSSARLPMDAIINREVATTIVNRVPRERMISSLVVVTPHFNRQDNPAARQPSDSEPGSAQAHSTGTATAGLSDGQQTLFGEPMPQQYPYSQYAAQYPQYLYPQQQQQPVPMQPMPVPQQLQQFYFSNQLAQASEQPYGSQPPQHQQMAQQQQQLGPGYDAAYNNERQLFQQQQFRQQMARYEAEQQQQVPQARQMQWHPEGTYPDSLNAEYRGYEPFSQQRQPIAFRTAAQSSPHHEHFLQAQHQLQGFRSGYPEAHSQPLLELPPLPAPPARIQPMQPMAPPPHLQQQKQQKQPQPQQYSVPTTTTTAPRGDVPFEYESRRPLPMHALPSSQTSASGQVMSPHPRAPMPSQSMTAAAPSASAPGINAVQQQVLALQQQPLSSANPAVTLANSQRQQQPQQQHPNLVLVRPGAAGPPRTEGTVAPSTNFEQPIYVYEIREYQLSLSEEEQQQPQDISRRSRSPPSRPTMLQLPHEIVVPAPRQASAATRPAQQESQQQSSVPLLNVNAVAHALTAVHGSPVLLPVAAMATAAPSQTTATTNVQPQQQQQWHGPAAFQASRPVSSTVPAGQGSELQRLLAAFGKQNPVVHSSDEAEDAQDQED